MTREQIDASNAKYHKLPLELIPEFNRLVGAAMNSWPAELLVFVQKRCEKYGMCGDVVTCAVADWLKGITS